MTTAVAEAFRECERLARTHYENFPVASLFLPKDLRPYVAAIYAFARTADDYADEGDRSAAERLAALDAWEAQLNACYAGNASSPVFIALHETILKNNIPRQPLADLLAAFKMDVTTNRYQTYDDLLFYCKHSANPVGRLVLYLFEDVDEEKLRLSDNICTALQLANFWQDIGIDARKNRIYLPLEEIERFGYTEQRLFEQQCDDAFVELLRFQVEKTRKLFEAGESLLKSVVPRLRFELTLTWRGGMKILDKIAACGFDVFRHRPVISTTDKLSILITSALQNRR